MAKDISTVQFVRSYNTRVEECEEKLSELSKAGTHFAKMLPEKLTEIERLEEAIVASHKRIAELQARRDSLKSKYMEAHWSGDEETARALQSERASIDSELEAEANKLGDAEATLNRTRASLEDTRARAFEVLDVDSLPDAEAFITEFARRIREQREHLVRRISEIEPNFLLPEEADEREQQQRNAEKAAEAAQRTQEKQERADRRRVLSRLLARESVSEPRRGNRPRRGSESWKSEAKARGIELPRYDNLPVTEAEFRLYAEVAAEYEALRKADGLSVEEESNQPKEYGPEDFTRSGYVSVM